MRISLRRCPPTSALFVDYLEHWPRVESFYPHQYSLDSIEQFARNRPALDVDHRKRLCSVLSEQQSAFGSSQRGVEKLAD